MLQISKLVSAHQSQHQIPGARNSGLGARTDLKGEPTKLNLSAENVFSLCFRGHSVSQGTLRSCEKRVVPLVSRTCRSSLSNPVGREDRFGNPSRFPLFQSFTGSGEAIGQFASERHKQAC